MASVHDVIRQYRPQLELEDPVPADEVVAYLAENSELEPEAIQGVLGALPDMLFHFLVQGRPVEFPAVGHVKPTIDLDGTIRADIDTAGELTSRMSEPDTYRAGINRRENIGVSLQRLAQMWNATHPDDAVEDADAYALVGK